MYWLYNINKPCILVDILLVQKRDDPTDAAGVILVITAVKGNLVTSDNIEAIFRWRT